MGSLNFYIRLTLVVGRGLIITNIIWWALVLCNAFIRLDSNIIYLTQWTEPTRAALVLICLVGVVISVIDKIDEL